jgi:abhydrolase domain-containing protein 6
MPRRRGPIFGRRRRRSRWRAPLWLAVLLLSAFLLAAWLRPQWFLQAEFARQRWLAGAEQRSVAIDGRRWNYLEAGSGPSLLLVHGFTGSKENWLPVIGELAREYRVLAPDLPGWGYAQADSPRPPYGYTADAARLAAFADALIGDSPFHLVGHSMGGGIAAVYAAGMPHRVERLVLMSAAGVEFDNPFARSVLAGEHPFGVRDRVSLDRFMQLVFDQPPWVPWPVDRALVLHRRANATFEREVLAAMSGGDEADAPARAAAAIRAPTLLLWCRDDRVIDMAAAAVYGAVIAQSSTVLLPDCSHMPMMEQPTATVRVLSGFLAGAAGD